MDPYDIGLAFSEIEDELIESMIRNMRRHRIEEVEEKKEWSQWQAEQLKALEAYKKANKKKFQERFADVNDLIDKAITEARAQGNMDQEIEILEAIKKGFTGYRKADADIMGEFFQLNDRKLEALIKATKDDFQKGEQAILRMAEDQYRQVIFNAQVYANTGAGTYEKAVDMATKDFLSRGINCIQYANGARHTMKDYADMAIRTAAKRAYLAGEGEKRKEWGISTVIVNKRGKPCPKCLPFVGKVLIDDVYSGGSRKDGKYPLLSRAMELGLYHPRCKDAHSTYFPGISTADDTWTKDELKVVSEDYKAEQKQQYAKRQAEKFERLEKYSLDEENRKHYGAKSKMWKSSSLVYEQSQVYYTPENDYTINLPEYDEKINNGLTKAAIDVAKKGSRDGFEHMYLVDLNNGGLEFYETNHESGSVGYDFWKVLDDNPDKEYTFVHNHNIISSFSETDLLTPITSDNISAMVAVQNDGVIYYAKKKKNAPEDFWPDDYYADELKSLNEDVKNGIITPAERNVKREEIITKCLLDEFYDGMVIIDGQRK